MACSIISLFVCLIPLFFPEPIKSDPKAIQNIEVIETLLASPSLNLLLSFAGIIFISTSAFIDCIWDYLMIFFQIIKEEEQAEYTNFVTERLLFIIGTVCN